MSNSLDGFSFEGSTFYFLKSLETLPSALVESAPIPSTRHCPL
jgi:hypothetical protein